MKPAPRPAARVFLVDARDRLLLFEGIVPGTDGPRLWVAPGGALRDGEIAASAEIFVPRRLADLLPPLLRGELPVEPVDAGI